MSAQDLPQPPSPEAVDEALAAETAAAASAEGAGDDAEPVDPATIVTAMVTCFDEQIDDMAPDPDFKTGHRAALVAELDRFAQLLA